MAYIIYKTKRSSHLYNNGDYIVGVCSNKNHKAVLEKLSKEYFEKGDSPELIDKRSQEKNLLDKIAKLRDTKIEVDLEGVPYEKRPIISRLKTLANKEVTRDIQEKEKRLNEVRQEIDKIVKNDKSPYYGVKYEVMKP